jgi:predicted heme/steroid binding protein
MTKQQILIVGLAIFCMGLLDWQILRSHAQTPLPPELPIYTATTLAHYDGTNPKEPVLLALDGAVYDVTAGAADFYAPGESYHYLVGKDSSTALHLFGADIIKRKYPVVGVYQP